MLSALPPLPVTVSSWAGAGLRALEWAEVSPVMVYAGPVLAVLATVAAVGGEVAAATHSPAVLPAESKEGPGDAVKLKESAAETQTDSGISEPPKNVPLK